MNSSTDKPKPPFLQAVTVCGNFIPKGYAGRNQADYDKLSHEDKKKLTDPVFEAIEKAMPDYVEEFDIKNINVRRGRAETVPGRMHLFCISVNAGNSEFLEYKQIGAAISELETELRKSGKFDQINLEARETTMPELTLLSDVKQNRERDELRSLPDFIRKAIEARY